MRGPCSYPRLLLALVLLAFAAPAIHAAQLTPTFERGELGLVLQGAGLPPTVRKDLISGLTNRIAIRVTLLVAERPIAQKLVGIAVKYDLWEETFAVRISVDDAPVAAMTYRSVEEVVALLTDLSLPRLFGVDPTGAGGGKSLALAAEVLFDPIEKERMEEIRKWVAENDRPNPPDATSVGTGLPAPRSTTSRLFNKIFDQYAAGASVAAAWKQTVSSEPFKLEELPHGP